MICIGCPMGCELTVSEKPEAFAVTGNACKIGERYAREETTNPTRNMTSTVRVLYGDAPMLSVKTRRPVPKQKVMDCAAALKDIIVHAPVHIGDVVVQNVADTGVDIVATREITRVAG